MIPFQIWGAAEAKARRPKSVFTLGTCRRNWLVEERSERGLMVRYEVINGKQVVNWVERTLIVRRVATLKLQTGRGNSSIDPEILGVCLYRASALLSADSAVIAMVLSVRLSVHLSVTLWYHFNKKRSTVMPFAPNGTSLTVLRH